MKKTRTLFAGIALISSAFMANAQTTLTPHFTDISKKIVVPKNAQVFPEIREGFIVVSDYPKVFYVNTNGEYIFGNSFPFTRGNDYIHSVYFSGGAMMAWRKKEGTYSASPFIIYPDGKYRDFPTGTKNAVGLSNDIFEASSFCDGYALVKRGNMVNSTQSFIDKNGKDVFPLLTSKQTGTLGDMTIYPVCENRRVYYNAELQKYGYADEKGKIIIKPQFDKALNFSEGLAAVMTKENYVEKWGFIDLTGKMVIPATYTLQPGRFSEGLAAVRIGESESNYEMAYIDKTGKKVFDNKPWNLNEFHNGYAWVGTGCDKLFVMNKEFAETRDMTADFYHNGDGWGVCEFKMVLESSKTWGFDFLPNGTQSLNQGGVGAGDIFAPDGATIFKCVDASGKNVNLHAITEGELMFCQVRMTNAPQLKEQDVYLSVFINQKGEIVYYFEEVEESVKELEGIKPVQVK